MKRLLAVLRRLRAYLLRPPAILASVDTRMVLTPDRITLAVALHGWGWIAISQVDGKPRWRDWQLFGRPSAHLVAPSGPQARISAINIFGRSATLWHRPPQAEPHTHACAGAGPQTQRERFSTTSAAQDADTKAAIPVAPAGRSAPSTWGRYSRCAYSTDGAPASMAFDAGALANDLGSHNAMRTAGEKRRRFRRVGSSRHKSRNTTQRRHERQHQQQGR